MSTKMLDLAWDADLTLSRKMVLIALADQANDYGECYPGIETLRRRCSMGLRTVYEALAELEAEGLVSREQLPGQKTLYRISIHALQQGELAIGGAAAAGCGRRTVREPQGAAGAPRREPQDAGNRKRGGAAAAVHKATNSKSNQREGSGHERTRGEQLEVMGSFDRTLIEPYLDTLPTGIDLQVFADFVKHRRVKGGPMSISSWKQVRAVLDAFAADGVDLNQCLQHTMLANLAVPVDPRPKSRAGPKRPRANDDFTNVRYQGTADDDLPAELRNNPAAGAV